MNISAIPHDRKSWERLAAELRPEGRALIAGRPQAAQDGRVFEDVSPIDGTVICEVARGAAADVDLAVAAARGARGGALAAHRPRSASASCGALRKPSRHTARLPARDRDVGKPIGNSVAVDVANCADCIEYYAEFADKLWKSPYRAG
jgi:gamma-glutamyl-gamma-aminobutyraldehyde dehydrogenase